MKDDNNHEWQNALFGVCVVIGIFIVYLIFCGPK